MFPTVLKNLVIPEKTAELHKSYSVKPAPSKPEVTKDFTDTVQKGDSQISPPSSGICHAVKSIGKFIPTHPHSPGVLSQFPPFE